MSQTLIEKMRKAREQVVTMGDYRITVRRPTHLQMQSLRERLAARDLSAVLEHIVGWDGVREIDIVPGGDPHPLAFDAGVCAEWLADREDLFIPVCDALLDACHKAVEASEARAKN